jgi:hypothetical protein
MLLFVRNLLRNSVHAANGTIHYNRLKNAYLEGTFGKPHFLFVDKKKVDEN